MNRISADQPDDVSYFIPLFNAALRYRREDHLAPLPAPEPGSSLLSDDSPLGSWTASTLIVNTFSAGLHHVDSLDRLVAELHHLDPVTPWTILRGAMENFSTALWLLGGNGRPERQHRALILWAQDFRNRKQCEEDTEFQPSRPKQQTALQRLDAVVAVAASLGFSKLPKLITEDIILKAATAAGLDDKDTGALWRVASGFAHGRQWPNLTASEVRDARRDGRGYTVGLVGGDDQLKNLSRAVLSLLTRAEKLYHARRVV